MFLDDGMFHSTSTRLESLLYGMWIIPFFPPQTSSYFIYPHWTDEIIVQTAPISLFSEILDGWISHTPITNTNQQKWRKEKKKKKSNNLLFIEEPDMSSLTLAERGHPNVIMQMLQSCWEAGHRPRSKPLERGPSQRSWKREHREREKRWRRMKTVTTEEWAVQFLLELYPTNYYSLVQSPTRTLPPDMTDFWPLPQNFRNKTLIFHIIVIFHIIIYIYMILSQITTYWYFRFTVFIKNT